ncbi:hypothetical protein KO481_37815 [Nocardia sp. NEAU-G5]|uniref:Uncharacterized protein n=1 Tax=Nocardia albiluteola TaxID=2842303 RepID=A0ABS6BAF2_9NOCA|nr:ETEC_3214 domain-containing protein [Nocardia albiluteola]MBU3067265.1 hypothetical protein [Nocardia albiluteola]
MDQDSSPDSAAPEAAAVAGHTDRGGGNPNAIAAKMKHIWTPFNFGIKAVLTISGLIAAVTLILQFAPTVWHKYNWRPVEYAQLNSLHAGENLEYFESKLGPPTLTYSEGPAAQGWRQMTYMRREHFVDIIVDSASRVEAYSVVSCSPDFTPTLTAPDGSIVSLNSTPLAHAQTATDETTDETTDSLNNGRYLSYFPGKSGTSLNSYLEAGPANGSEAANEWSFYVGISALCLATWKHPDIFGKIRDYKGRVLDAPPEVKNIREKVAANLYAETAPSSSLVMIDDGRLTFSANSSQKYPEPGFYVGPFWMFIPGGINREGTKIF